MRNLKLLEKYQPSPSPPSKKENLNLQEIAICTGASSNTILDYNLVRFEVCMIKLRHQRMLILRCILPPKTELPPEKKVTPLPPATT